MLEFFNRQSNFVKTLIIAVLVVVVAFIVYQIYKRFIKGMMIKEMFEDIKIVIESTCPDGYHYNDIANQCQPCYAPLAVNTTGDSCIRCSKFDGQVVEAGDVEGSNTLGKRCVLVATGKVPDPNVDPNNKNLEVEAVVPIPLNTSARTGYTNSLSLIATSNTNTSNQLALLSIKIAPERDDYIRTSANPDTDFTTFETEQHAIKGNRVTEFKVFGIYLQDTDGTLGGVIPDGTFKSFTTMYGNSNTSSANERGKNYVPYLFGPNLQTQIKDLFFEALFGTGYKSVPNLPTEVSYTFISNESTNNEYNLDATSSRFVKNIPAGFWIDRIRMTSNWDCGSAIVTTTDSSCTGNRMNGDIQYNINNSINIQSAARFVANCPNIIKPLNPDGTGGVKCNIGIKNCTVRTQTPTSYIPAYPRYNPITGSYTFLDTYLYDITQFPNGDGAIQCTDSVSMGYKDESGGVIGPLGAGEGSVNYNTSTFIIKRGCTLNYSGIPSDWAGENKPNTPLPNGGTNPLDYDKPYMNPLWKATNTAEQNKNKSIVIYRPADSNKVSGVTNNAAASSCKYYKASLPLLLIYPNQPVTDNNEGYDKNTKRKTRILKARRNIYETIFVNTTQNTSDPNNIYTSLSRALTAMGIVSSAARINTIKFMGDQFGLTDLQNNTASTTSNLSASIPITTPTTSTPVPRLSSPIRFQTGISNIKSIVTVSGATTQYIVSPPTSSTTSGKVYKIASNVPTSMTLNFFRSPFVQVSSNLNKFTWVASSSTNQGIILACAYEEDLYRSYDGGLNWYGSSYVPDEGTALTSVFTTTDNNYPDLRFTQVCMSNDGVMQYTCSFNGHIYFSFNSGYTWNKYVHPVSNVPAGQVNLADIFNTPQRWKAISCSADGTRVSAVVGRDDLSATSVGGNIYTATVSFGSNTSIASTPNTPSRTVTLNQKSTPPNFTWIMPMGLSEQSDTSVVNGNPRSWKQISISNTGKYQTAIIENGLLARSYPFSAQPNGTYWSFRDILINNLGNGQAQRNWTDVKISPIIADIPPITNTEGMFQVAIESVPTSVYQLAPGETISSTTEDSTGIYFSKDYGASWTAVLSLTNVAGRNPHNWVNVDIGMNNVAYITSTTGFVVTLDLNKV